MKISNFPFDFQKGRCLLLSCYFTTKKENQCGFFNGFFRFFKVKKHIPMNDQKTLVISNHRSKDLNSLKKENFM